MSFLVQYDLLLYLIFAVCVFFISYRFFPPFLRFAYDKTTSSQKEIIEIIEKMRIQKDHKKTVMYLWGLSLAMGLIPVVITLPHFLAGVGIGIISFFMTWVGVRSIMRSLWTRYCFLVVEQMLEGMVLMANGMKVGLSVTQSMERVIDGMKGPLSSEFTLVLNKIKLGMSVEEAMREMAERVPMPDVIMLVTSINILKETGGNLAETFAVIAETIRSRQKVESKIKALTAQGMMQARIISAVPFVIMGLLYFINRSYAVVLFTTVLGLVCVAFVVVLVIIGGKMMKKVATIDV